MGLIICNRNQIFYSMFRRDVIVFYLRQIKSLNNIFLVLSQKCCNIAVLFKGVAMDIILKFLHYYVLHYKIAVVPPSALSADVC
jgi:hypothetical protein